MLYTSRDKTRLYNVSCTVASQCVRGNKGILVEGGSSLGALVQC